jgi:alpha-D-ribose 1-methylphosphonate 5-triphosphate synthase subunit PhnH
MFEAEVLSGGFSNPAQDSARAFRACLEAMARPGRIQQIVGAVPPAPLSPAAGAILLTLADATTPIFIAKSHDTEAVRKWIAFHCSAPVVVAGEADFAIGTWDALQPVSQFAIGTAEYPDRSATLIVECEDISAPMATLSGPGIETTQTAYLPTIDAFVANGAQFPLGFDCYFTAGSQLSALPRSTKVEAL